MLTKEQLDEQIADQKIKRLTEEQEVVLKVVNRYIDEKTCTINDIHQFTPVAYDWDRCHKVLWELDKMGIIRLKSQIIVNNIKLVATKDNYYVLISTIGRLIIKKLTTEIQQ